MNSSKKTAYSGLRDGKITWFDDEPTQPLIRKMRSRLETDDEFRKRILHIANTKGIAGWDPHWGPNTIKHLAGKKLDEHAIRFSYYDLTEGFVPFKRIWIDEIVK